MSQELEQVHEKFSPWVKQALKTEGFEDVQLKITGMTDKGDNYMGDVIFLEAKGTDTNGEKKEVHLVIKKGKDDQKMRENMQARLFYLRENIVYTRIFPAFKKFQLERDVREIFDSVPKCYAILDEDESEAILFENLRKSGYELHNRYVNMNKAHIKLILYQYAKFHAISFAMRDQETEEFDRLTKDFSHLFGKMLENGDTALWYDLQLQKVINTLKEIDPVVEEKFKKKTEKGLANVLKELWNDQPEECVITHGDCWNNNFMFQYKDSDKNSPSKVSILDWQLSVKHSPVIDLSYFLYIVSCDKDAANFDHLLRYYHDHLRANIREMGSDPDKLFPFSTLVRHWEKYSVYGISFACTSLEAMTSDKENAVSIEDLGNMSKEEAAQIWSNIKPKHMELYKDRLFGSCKHYCNGIRDEA